MPPSPAWLKLTMKIIFRNLIILSLAGLLLVSVKAEAAKNDATFCPKVDNLSVQIEQDLAKKTAQLESDQDQQLKQLLQSRADRDAARANQIAKLDAEQ